MHIQMMRSSSSCRMLRPGRLYHTRKNSVASLLAECQVLVPGLSMICVSEIGCPQIVLKHYSVQGYVSNQKHSMTQGEKGVLTMVGDM